MAVENLVGLYVRDEETYAKYREAMFPILQEYEGGFGYDFKVSETLKSETIEPINRVFTIHFSSQAQMDAFFADEKYLKVKEKFFTPSVTSTTRISTYEKS